MIRIMRNSLRAYVRVTLATLLLSATTFSWAQQADVTLNGKDADRRKVVEAVSEVTGKNFILDPRVTGKVTLLSATPMSPDAFYEAFLSILQVHGYVAITSGDLIKIIPDATARQFAGPIGTSGAAGPDDLATQVIQVRNVGATQLVPILRPLIPQYGHMVAHAGSNMLIISDRAANVARMVSIIRRIDQASDEDIEVVPLEHASAAEIVRIMTALSQTPRADGVTTTTSLVADPRTNSVLIGGDKSDRLRLRTLIARLDTPLEDGGDTKVRYLRYADAEELATKLQQHFTAQAGGAAQAAAAPSSTGVSVWADAQTNALVVNAPPKMMRSLMQIVDKLDIRRAQVLVEHFQDKSISQIYATHTDRTYNTVASLAKARDIVIQQVPRQGQLIDGKSVTNRSSGKIAIKPMIESLKQVEQGSATIVSANSGNLFAIMSGIGVPVKGEAVCTDSEICLPCKSKKCFPKKEFNNIWTVSISSDGKASLKNSKYGD